MAQIQKAFEAESNNQSTPQVDAKFQFLRSVLLLTIVLATYLNTPLVSGGRLLVPSFPTVALLPLLFLTVRRAFSTTDKVFLLKITFLLLLSIAFSPGYSYLSEKFLSLIQCILALAVTVMTVRLIQDLRLDILERALLVLWILIVTGAVLEVLGVIREASDTFRAWAYEGTYTLYQGADRDIRFVGWERPKLFSTEPSHVTTVFIVAINCWLMVRVTKLKIAVVVVASTAMLVIMGSPMLVVSAAITLAILLWNKNASVASRVTMVLAAIIVGTVFVTVFAESTLSTVTSRIDRIGDQTTDSQLETTSENRRVVYPFKTLIETWSRWPMFGAGIGGREVVMNNITFPGVDPRHVVGTNGMAHVGTFLGVFGGALFIWFLLKEAAHTGVQRIGLLVVIVALLAQLQGGIESFRFWGFIAPLWGVLAYADLSDVRDGSPKPKGTR